MEVLDQEALLESARQFAIARLIAEHLKEYRRLVGREFERLLKLKEAKDAKEDH